MEGFVDGISVSGDPLGNVEGILVVGDMEGFVDGISVSGDELGDAEGLLISGDAPEKKFMDNENNKIGHNKVKKKSCQEMVIFVIFL